MKSKRFTGEKIIRILQEADGGLSVADVCRKHNCSEQSFYRWKTKFGGTYLRDEYDVSERRACQAMQISRASYRYVGQDEFRDECYRQVVRLSGRYPYWGYRKIYDLMKADGIAIGRERVRLIRRREGLRRAC